MTATTYTFGPFRLDARAQILFRGSEPIALGQRATALLCLLVEQPGAPVSKDALLEAAWPGLAVEDNNLTVQIAALRRALGGEPGGEGWIETLPRRGYRYIGPAVTEQENGVSATPLSQQHIATTPSGLAPTRGARAEPERRQLTVMSCELIGLATHDGLDLEEMHEIIGTYHRCVTETVGRFGGYVGKRVGNSVLVYFGYPATHEHDAERAVQAGIALCARVRALKTNVPLQCRIGIATGLVIIGDLVDVGGAQDHGIVGDAPNMASRLHGLAQPETIAIEQTTRRLIGSLFDCRELGSLKVDGAVETAPVWIVLGPGNVESRFEALRAAELTPLVGREEELELLQRRWAKAKNGEGRVVLISGEPGIGKSRLAQALQDVVQSEPHVRLRYFCSPHHTDSALYPVTQHLRCAAGIACDDSDDEKLAKLEALISYSGVKNCDHAAILAELLSIPSNSRYPPLDLSPQRRKARTLACLLELLKGLAARQPLLIAFEDAHWIDPTTSELLDLTVNSVQTLPILLIVTFRPEFAATWIGQPHVSVQVLSRLGRRDAEVLVAGIVGNRSVPREVLNQILARTDGVPLFIEELTKSILESSIFTSDMAQQGFTRPLPMGAVPTTLHGSLMMRLDRLGPGRDVAQIGATIGREFSFELLSAVAQMSDDGLRLALQELIDAQLVFCRGTPPDAEFSFKHALVQDTAYDSLLKGRRSDIHHRIAEAICDHFPAYAETSPEIVAHHLTQSGQSDAAIIWWNKAGIQALQRSNFLEAIAHFQKAIALADGPAIASVPKIDRLRLQIAYGQALIPAYGHAAPDTTKAFARARELLAGIENTAERYSVYYGLWVGSYLRGDVAPMLEIAQLCQDDTKIKEGSAESCVGHRICGTTRWWQGDYVGARDHFERGAAAYDFDRDHTLAFSVGQDIGVCAILSLSLVLWPLGEISKALELTRQGVDLAARSEHTPTIAWAQCHHFFFEAVRDNATRATLDGEALVSLGQKHELPQWVAYGTFFQGWSRRDSGDSSTGLDEMRRGIELLRKLGIVAFIPLLLGLLSQAEIQRGNIRSARSILDDALGEVRRTGDVRHEAELYRRLATLLLLEQPDKVAAAEKLFARALSIAREQETKTFELRAATGLAKLWRDQGRCNEARELLVPIRRWFSDRSEESGLDETTALMAALH
jgi:class 3 adenylate cyclase/predicted ATPase